MQYYVTFETFYDNGKPGPVALDNPEPRTLEAALTHACKLITEGKENVTIRGDNGHTISGHDLAACCRREKTLTDDLQAN
jgi:hypothetical protein